MNETPLRDRFQKLEGTTGLVLIGITFLLVVILGLNYFDVISLTKLSSKLNWLPKKITKVKNTQPIYFKPKQQTFTEFIESCSTDKANNPLIHDVRSVTVNNPKLGKQTIIVGNLLGVINVISFTKATQTASPSASLELISEKGDQSYTFSLKQEQGLVYNSTLRKEVTLSDLHRGKTAILSFNCFPTQEKDKKFKITRIAITGK